MNPAFSVIFLTTLIGAGQGLFLALFAVQSGIIIAPAAPARAFLVIGDAVALAFLVTGLIASFFHLGHPERAWRAVAMWRTSWLSREVIVLPVFMAVVALHGWCVNTGCTYAIVIGVAGAVLCFALFYITAMNYVCIKFLQEWATPLTIVNYTLLGCASGFTLATALAAALDPALTQSLSRWALILTLAAGAARVASLVRNARIRPKSNLQSAIGVRHPHIVQKAQGFMGSSFNTREFFHGRTKQMVQCVKWGFLLLAFVAPVVLLGLGSTEGRVLSTLGAGITFLIQYAGLLAERWFFFAQANHPQNLYYQAAS
jgi:DMSO reductase anchor subunit